MSNTLFVGKVYHRFDELPSTNDRAAQIIALSAKTRPPEGTVVRADNQTAGRGQLGSRWQSMPGENLLLSVILYPSWLQVQAQFQLSMAMALGVYDLLKRYEAQLPSAVSIKWPNDLYLQNKKVAGILLQNSLSGSVLQSCIAGIGLNVNQLSFSPDLPNAGSMAQVFGQKFDLDEVANGLFECLEKRYLQLKAGHAEAIKSAYEEKLLRLHETSRFIRSADGAEMEGMILGVTDRGLLRVRLEDRETAFEIKEVQMVI